MRRPASIPAAGKTPDRSHWRGRCEAANTVAVEQLVLPVPTEPAGGSGASGGKPVSMPDLSCISTGWISPPVRVIHGPGCISYDSQPKRPRVGSGMCTPALDILDARRSPAVFPAANNPRSKCGMRCWLERMAQQGAYSHAKPYKRLRRRKNRAQAWSRGQVSPPDHRAGCDLASPCQDL